MFKLIFLVVFLFLERNVFAKNFFLLSLEDSQQKLIVEKNNKESHFFECSKKGQEQNKILQEMVKNLKLMDIKHHLTLNTLEKKIFQRNIKKMQNDIMHFDQKANQEKKKCEQIKNEIELISFSLKDVESKIETLLNYQKEKMSKKSQYLSEVSKIFIDHIPHYRVIFENKGHYFYTFPNEEIKALFDGEIVIADKLGGLGTLITLKTEKNFYLSYLGPLHLSPMLIGKKIKKGDVLGVTILSPNKKAIGQILYVELRGRKNFKTSIVDKLKEKGMIHAKI